MVNYQQGKIYKIISGDLTYIGSTCEYTLAKRMTHHRGCYKQWLNGMHSYTTSFELMGNEDAQIILLELYPCGSKDELHARERYHIENNECVNKVIPSRTQKEYYEANKEELLKKKKVYYHDNKDKGKLYREENKDKIRAYYIANKNRIKAYYEANKESILESKKLYYQTKQSEISEKKKAYYKKKNP